MDEMQVLLQMKLDELLALAALWSPESLDKALKMATDALQEARSQQNQRD